MNNRDFVHRQRRRSRQGLDGSNCTTARHDDDLLLQGENPNNDRTPSRFVRRRRTTTSTNRQNHIEMMEEEGPNRDDDESEKVAARPSSSSTTTTTNTSYRRRTRIKTVGASRTVQTSQCSQTLIINAGNRNNTPPPRDEAQNQLPIKSLTIKAIPIRFAQSYWNISKLFCDSTQIILDYVLYQHGIIPMPMQQIMMMQMREQQNDKEEDGSTTKEARRSRLRSSSSASTTHRSSPISQLQQTRQELLDVLCQMFLRNDFGNRHQDPFKMNNEEWIISISFGGSNNNRNRLDTCYLISMKLPNSSSLEEEDNKKDRTVARPFQPSISAHTQAPQVPPLDRLARKLLTTIMSSMSGNHNDEAGDDNRIDPRPPSPPRPQQYNDAMIHMWMETSTLEQLWQTNKKNNENNDTTKDKENDLSNTVTSFLLSSLKPDKVFTKKIHQALALSSQPQQKQSRQRRRQQPQIYNIQIQLPTTTTAGSIDDRASNNHSRSTGSVFSNFKDNDTVVNAQLRQGGGMWMQLCGSHQRPTLLKRVEPW